MAMRRRKMSSGTSSTAAGDVASGTLAPLGGLKVRYETGEMTLSPIQYHSFKVGAVAAEWTIQEGRDVRAELAAAAAELDEFFNRRFEIELERFEQRTRQASEHLRRARTEG